MMTLLEIAQSACDTMMLDDSETLIAAKACVRKRWKLLWSATLWQQARTVASVTLAAGTDIVTLPATMELAGMVRRVSDGTLIPVEHEVAAMMCDPDAFRAGTGVPDFWTLIEPAGGQARLRFSYAPSADLALSVVGKRACPDLADGDKPTIPGADLALVAHVEADLYESVTRQVGKAQVKRQEAMGIQQLMVEQAIEQSGQIQRLVPWDGGGAEEFRFSKS